MDMGSQLQAKKEVTGVVMVMRDLSFHLGGAGAHWGLCLWKAAQLHSEVESTAHLKSWLCATRPHCTCTRGLAYGT